jgi:2-O-methyltransferase
VMSNTARHCGNDTMRHSMLRARPGRRLRLLANWAWRQLDARHALAAARDPRFARPLLQRRVLDAARRWLPVLPPSFRPQTVLDVGANLGNVTMELHDLYHPEFIGIVEANPELTEALLGISLECRSKVFACAIGSEPGRLPFHIVRKGDSLNSASSSLLSVSAEAAELWRLNTERTVDVPVRTLDEVWQECGARDLDLLKLDVQGYEPQVLMGGKCTLLRTRVIVTEMSFFREYEGQWLFGQLYELLQQSGFDLSATYEFARDPRGVPLQCNGVFVNTSLRTVDTPAKDKRR